MRPFAVKVCGITRVGDAQLVALLGGDMIGLIFYRRSPRFVSLAIAGEIVRSLPATVDRVGVFVDEEVDRILKLAFKLRLDYIQLHGNEPPSDITRLKKNGLKVIKSFGVKRSSDYEAVMACKADLVLLDNSSTELPGGTGRAFDWRLKPPKKIPNLMLSGGITLTNVAAGVGRFDPLVVDVNSGVESSPGKKSRAALKQFFEICNELRYGC